MFLGLNILSSIVEKSKNFPPKKITCSLCYAIAYDGRQCNNRKCQNVFCGDCFQIQRNKFFDRQKQEFKCPFCQTFSGFSKLAPEIIEYFDGFKYYCIKNKNCKEQYTFSQMVIDHKHTPNSGSEISYDKEICYICKEIISETNVNTIKCVLCNNIGCFKNISYNAIEKINFDQNVKTIKNNEYCIQKCYICKLPVCKYCSKQNYEKNNIMNFICEECNQETKCSLCNNNNAKNICTICKKYLCEFCTYKCKFCGYILCLKNDCISEKIKCQNCINIFSKLVFDGCKHKEILNCLNCFPKCYLCKKNISDIRCNYCFNEICYKNCSIKCRFCSFFYCNKCTLMCSICKKFTCTNCANFCQECDIHKTLIVCKKCHSNVIKNCQYNKEGNCNKRLCISCWNVCNYCGIIYCSNHCNNCSNCEDTICDNHFTKCAKCLKKEEMNYIKLCLKRCVLKCSFCDNQTTVMCKEKNHLENYVHDFGCNHFICNSCIKKCETCGKIVRKCLECIDYFYELCRYCQKYQCLSCCNKCKNCDDVFCSLNHKCSLCGNICEGKCFNCDINLRIKCNFCKEKLKICEKCKNKYICGFDCYKKYKDKLNKENSNEHLCQMFLCEKHFNC